MRQVVGLQSPEQQLSWPLATCAAAVTGLELSAEVGGVLALRYSHSVSIALLP